MKRLLVLLNATIISISAYSSGLLASTELDQQIHGDAVEYQSLVEQALSYRQVTLQTYQ